ncbi:anthranilate synthase component II [Ostreibacterium oceani]|uniref:Anthranilate/aminodeoxychorismate synthase component II n=1 Tax=Ostreibacterium oceani TaxID=2654998 RepID=A0A6N7F016_9GAMM|nr:aminodeoxychorismate/anthranilate synthase component II [Ostreibacterium oceani]MPV86969.1 anthranilate/aminodeoxychorismate synthase component II [Ostreibacterium oceani]
MAQPKLLMIDNYDSFVYNLVQYFSELGCEVVVARNDQITVEAIRSLDPRWIVLSPGPRTPNEAGVCLSIVQQLSDEYPILGVCLGHQTIAQAFGGDIVHAKHIMHGKVSQVYHNGDGLYQGIESPVCVTRYHSLVVAPQSMPACLDVTGYVLDEHGELEEVMSFCHKSKPIYGVQFHPESIMTESGHQMLNNFLSLT